MSQEMSLDRMCREYLLSLRLEPRSPHTVRWYEQKLAYFVTYARQLGLDQSIEAINRTTIRSFMGHLAEEVRSHENNPRRPTDDKPLSPETVHGYFRALRAFFSWVVREGFLAESPMSGLRAPKLPQKLMPFFSETEVARMLGGPHGGGWVAQREHTILVLLLDTGMRASELTGLKMSDVSLDQGYLKVLGKGNKERIVPMGRQCQRTLARYLRHGRPQPALPNLDNVFLTRDGHHLRNDYLYKIVAGAAARAGITGKRVGPHTCRHTFARSFLNNGGNLIALQRILGHSSLEMVRRYINLQASDLVQQQAKYSPVDVLMAAT